jgi:hypothetical protein
MASAFSLLAAALVEFVAELAVDAKSNNCPKAAVVRYLLMTGRGINPGGVRQSRARFSLRPSPH